MSPGYGATRGEQKSRTPDRRYHRKMSSASDASDRRIHWNERYADEPSTFGEANQFVVEHLSDLEPQRVLDAACGQGRNAVWLAERGHDVTGVDLSDVAIGQAGRLAEHRGVEVELVAADLTEWEPERGQFDLVLLSYLQLPPAIRTVIHRRVGAFLLPGGRVFAIAHHSDNLDHGIGGPDRPEVLYREEDLAGDFASFDIERNEAVHRAVDKPDQKGTAIDLLFIARRRDES